MKKASEWDARDVRRINYWIAAFINHADELGTEPWLAEIIATELRGCGIHLSADAAKVRVWDKKAASNAVYCLWLWVATIAFPIDEDSESEHEFAVSELEPLGISIAYREE